MFYFFMYFLLNLTTSAWGTTIALSCLDNETNDHKVVLIYDRHPKELCANHETESTADITDFIKDLSSSSKKSNFYLEYPEKTTNFKMLADWAIHIPIKRALASNMKDGSINYISFDDRSEEYHWVTLMLENKDMIIKSYEKLPKEFKEVSIKSYIKSVETLKKETSKTIDTLDKNLKNALQDKFNFYNLLLQQLNDLKTKYNVSDNEHTLHLIKVLDKNELIHLLTNHLQAHSAYTDIPLIDKILNSQNQLSVVHAGFCHSYFIEKILLIAGYKNHFAPKDYKNGLVAEQFDAITLPKHIPPHLLKKSYAFLKLCYSCGQETTKKCSACKDTYFCSTPCQKKTWATHKLDCVKKIYSSYTLS